MSGLVTGSPPDNSQWKPDVSGADAVPGFPTAAADQPFGPAGTLSVLPDLNPPKTPVVVQSSPYYEYACIKILFDDSGLEVNEVLGPPGTPGDVVRVVAPYGWMIVKWISKRRGALPTVPSRDLQDANAVYKRGWRSFAVPGYLVNGASCLQVEGEYLYKLRVPYKESDPVLIGAMPYSSDPSSAFQMKPENYGVGIVGPNTPPAGAPADKITF